MTNALPVTEADRRTLREKLDKAMQDYHRHELNAASLISTIDGQCGCAEAGDPDCACGDLDPADLRTDAATEAQLAQAAATMAQAMATLLAVSRETDKIDG